jgi:hypothetical protein
LIDCILLLSSKLLMLQLDAAINSGNSGALNLGTTTTTGAVLYQGAGEATTKAVNLSSTTASAILLSSGSGALVLSRGITATGAGSKTFILGGTSTAANEGAPAKSGGDKKKK